MDSMQVNKAIAAVLVSGIAYMGATLISQGLVHPRLLEATAVKVDTGASQSAPAAKPSEDPPIAALLASADPKKGQADTQAAGCVACHSFNEGGKAGVGPNLYGVVGGPHGHMEGYAYSTALKSKSGPWTYEALNEWLKKPAAYAPGTKMSYAGLPDPQKRAEIIAYLRTLSPNPQPLPAAPAASAAPKPAEATKTASASPAPAPAAGGGEEKPFDVLLASADANTGKALTTKLGCVACHSFNEGGKAGLGPNLYGVVGGPKAHMQGYAYSEALKGKGGEWTFDELNKWLTKPAAYAPGTKMTFAGVANAQQRADVIAYLRTLSANPVPLPGATAAKAEAPAEAAKPAEGETKAQ